MVERKEDGSDVSEATVRLLVDGERVLAVGEGVGPVHALDQALRRALTPRHPELTDVSLVDFKVRILDGRAGTRAVTRVLVTSADPDAEWTTVGVSDDIVTASWEALADGIHYGLLRAKQEEGPGSNSAVSQWSRTFSAASGAMTRAPMVRTWALLDLRPSAV